MSVGVNYRPHSSSSADTGMDGPGSSNNFDRPEPEVAAMVLYKNRVMEKKKITPFQDLEDYGVHFNDSGECGDKILLNLLLSIVKSLGIDHCASETSKDLEAENKTYLQKMEVETGFVEDSLKIFDVIKKDGIKNGRITFRYLTHFSQRWLAAPQSGRQSLIEEITDIMSGTKTMGGFTTRLVGLTVSNPGSPLGYGKICKKNFPKIIFLLEKNDLTMASLD